MFREKHFITGDYFLMEGEMNSLQDLYLFEGNGSVSVAGPLYRIGWSEHYIIFAGVESPTTWHMIKVKDHTETKITEAQRVNDKELQRIPIYSAVEAWSAAEQ